MIDAGEVPAFEHLMDRALAPGTSNPEERKDACLRAVGRYVTAVLRAHGAGDLADLVQSDEDAFGALMQQGERDACGIRLN